jgi:hypothetical protein
MHGCDGVKRAVIHQEFSKWALSDNRIDSIDPMGISFKDGMELYIAETQTHPPPEFVADFIRRTVRGSQVALIVTKNDTFVVRADQRLRLKYSFMCPNDSSDFIVKFIENSEYYARLGIVSLVQMLKKAYGIDVGIYANGIAFDVEYNRIKIH